VLHAVLLPGMAIVPVGVGGGLSPGDAISVEPRGMPVGATVEPVPIPSGDVAPMVGVGVAIPLTCAMATLQASSVGRIVPINKNLIGVLHLQTALSRGGEHRKPPLPGEARIWARMEWLPNVNAGLSSFGGGDFVRRRFT
jgi:hypothetical protein